MKVFLREKKLSKGRRSLYLDFYPPIPHPETRKPTRREHLKLYIYEKPKPQTRIGYKRQSDLGGTEFIFTSGQFADLCRGYNQKRILSELENLKFLITYSEARSKQMMVKLPDFKGRQRCYVLTLDNGE